MGQESIAVIPARWLVFLALCLAGACWWVSPVSAQPELAPYTVADETDPLVLVKLFAAGNEDRRSEIANRLSSLDQPGVFDLLLSIARDGKSDLRTAAALALAYCGDQRGVEPLLATLHADDPVMRGMAIDGLGLLREPRALEPLLEIARDLNSGLYGSCVKALGNYSDRRAADVLIEALRCDDPAVRREAASGLAGMMDLRALEPLLAAAGDEDAEVRANVLRALPSYPISTIRPVLIHGLTDADAGVRQAALDGFGSAVGNTYDVRIWSDAVPPLIACLNDGDPVVREQAANLLGKLNDPRAVEPLCRCLRPDDTQLMNYALGSLRQLRDARAIEPLLAALENPGLQGNRLIINTLAALDEARAVAACARLLNSPDETVFANAVSGLRRMARQGKPILAGALNTTADPQRRRTLAVALANLGDPQAIEPLLADVKQQDDAALRANAITALLRFPLDPRVQNMAREGLAGPDPKVRSTIISSIRYRVPELRFLLLETYEQQTAAERIRTLQALRYGDGTPDSLEKLIALRDEPDARMREILLDAINTVGFGDERALEVLAEFTQDPEPSVRSAAVERLARWYLPYPRFREQVFTVFTNLLADADTGVRRQAATALGRTCEEKALEPLLAAARDPKPEVRLNAAYALAMLGDDRAVEPLMAMAGDWYEGPRRAAKDALGRLGETRAAPALVRVGLRELGAGIFSAKQRGNLVDSLSALRTLNGTQAQESAIPDAPQVQNQDGLLQLLSSLNGSESMEHEALQQLAEPRYFEQLLAILQDEMPGTVWRCDEKETIQSEAIWALGLLGDPRAIEPLIGLLNRSSQRSVCRSVLSALMGFDDPRVVPCLLTAMQCDQYGGLDYASALDRYNDPRIFPEFRRVFATTVDTQAKASFAVLLAKHGDPQAFAFLLDGVKNVTPQGVYDVPTVFELLGQTGDARALEPLLAAAKEPAFQYAVLHGLQTLMEHNPDPALHGRCITAILELLRDKTDFDIEALTPLITTKDARAVEPLLRVLKTAYAPSGIYEQAAEGLAAIGGLQVLSELLDVLQNSPIPQQVLAARALARCDDPRVTPALIAALRQNTTPVRMQAAESLGRLKTPDAVEPLITALEKDTSSRVRNAAAAALAEITGQAFGANPAQWREWFTGQHG